MTVVGGDVQSTSAQVQARTGAAAGPRTAPVRRVAMALALVAGGAVALTACSGQPGAAAVVDGQVITSTEVQQVLDELGPYLQSATTSSVLTILVQEPAVAAVAEEHGVAVSDSDAEAALSQVAAADGIDGSDFSDASLTVAKFSVAYNQLTQLDDADAINDELIARVADLDVEVNPRFGTLDAGNFVSDPSVRPWILQASAASGDTATDAPTEGATPAPTATSGQ